VWVGYRPGQFELIKGHPKSFSKTKGVVRTFCANCGTSISYHDEGISNELYVAVGFFDHPESFRPEAHAYWREKLSWIGDNCLLSPSTRLCQSGSNFLLEHSWRRVCR
jgi:hypothetical protein